MKPGWARIALCIMVAEILYRLSCTVFIQKLFAPGGINFPSFFDHYICWIVRFLTQILGD